MKQLTICYILAIISLIFIGQSAKIDAQEGEPFIPSRPEGSILDIEYSPNGAMIAMIYAEGRVVVREILSGTIIFDQILPTEYLLIRARVAWSPTGDRLAAGVASHVYIWNTNNFILIQSLMTGSEDALVYQEQDIYYPAGFYDVEWSYDGEFLFSNSMNTRYTIWSFQNNVFIVDQIIGGNPSPAVLFADDQRVSMGSHYFDIKTQTITRLDVNHYYCTRPTVTMASNSTRTLLVIGGLRGCVSELDPIMGQETIFYQLYEDGDIRDVAWSPDNSIIVAIDTAGRLYQIERASAEFIVLADVGTELYAVAWSPDGEQIAYGGAPLASGEDSFNVVSLSSNFTPTANAGPGQTFTADSTNTATITLDGSASVDPYGEIVSYVWTLDGVEIATGAIVTEKGSKSRAVYFSSFTGRLIQKWLNLRANTSS